MTASDMGISESYIEPNNSGSFYLKSRFTVDGTVKEGDYFTVKMPNTVNTFGDTRHSPDYQEKLKNANGQVIALGNYDVDSHTLTYTFTDVVNNLENVTGSFNLTQFMDRQVAKDSQTYQLNYEIAGEKLDTQIRVNYGQYYTVGDSNLKSMITMEDPKSGDYEQYIYVNPLQKTANGTVVRVQGFQTDPTKSNGQVNQNATQIKILKVANDQPLNSSFGVNDGDYEDVTNQFQVNYSDKNYADINFGNLNGQRYIIKVTSKEVPDSKEDLNLRAIMATKNIYGQYNYITWDNDIVRSTSSGTADGNEASYQLGDKVWNDVNKNGIQDQGETGIADVKVTLKDLDGNILDTTYTNTNGKYIFDNLKNGNYQVDFETPEGYAASPSNQGNDALDSDGPTNAQAVISDGNNLTVDQGFYQTETPTHNVGDKVWEDLNKDGIQDQNEPGIAIVKVTLKDADGNVVDTRTTDDKGNYLFEKVKEGEYTIEFETPEGYTPTQTGQGRVSTDSNGTSSLILVEGNDDLTIDSGFYKEPVTHKVGDKVWDDLNKDGIQDDNEPGISNVKVTLKDADGNVVDTRTTDANGNYLFENVKEGDYTIEFETPEGYTPTVTGQGTSDNDSNGTSTKVTVKDGDDLTIDSGFTQVTPEPPTEPENPSPEQPSEPGQPENPSPEQPSEPGQPENPSPEQPSEPGQPENPSPEQPSEPGQPENPSPEQPSEPGQPENPSPEQPSEPGQPKNPSPEQPNNPSVPGVQNPEKPSLTPVTQPVHSNGNKAKPSQQQKALPETGETESHQGTLFGGILAALGALLFARKKRHDKKQSH
ncbi:fibrinogen-binding adhesin SdrG C-terminal domain-containing protein [Staphylococcus pseudintermedius]|nr:fibrinogen-binding adhesin SdrG C-terminal domain-containing protein [Staphylococcus pseudintermedius]